MSGNTICILGGSGFVGSRLVARLAARGAQIRIPTRYREASRHLLVLPTVRLVQSDVHDAAELRRLLDGADTVINLVGILNETRRNSFARIYVDLTTNLLAAAEAAGVRRLLQMSALNADTGAPSRYLRSRGEAETRLREHRGALAWTLFRPSVIFGNGDSFINRFVGLLKTLPAIPLARARARLAPVYVENVVDAFVCSIDRDACHGQTYELCGPEVLELKDIVERIGRTAGYPRPVIALPDPLGRLQAHVAQWLPGKPFSIDNFRSLCVDSICREDGFSALGLDAHSFTATLPVLLQGDRDSRLRRWRSRT